MHFTIKLLIHVYFKDPLSHEILSHSFKSSSFKANTVLVRDVCSFEMITNPLSSSPRLRRSGEAARSVHRGIPLPQEEREEDEEGCVGT